MFRQLGWLASSEVLLPVVAGSYRCEKDAKGRVTALLGLSPKPTPYLALGLTECLDNVSAGFSSLSDPQHAANLLPRSP